MVKKKRGVVKKKRCRHIWIWESHNDYRDGEYYVCEKCGAIKWK